MLAVPNKQTVIHMVRVINPLSLSILTRCSPSRCSPFATPLGVRNPIPFMPHSAELNRKFPQIVELLKKPSTLTQGHRKPRKEELIGPFSLPRISKEGEFSEAVDLIGDL